MEVITMKKETILQFLNSEWVYVRRTNGYSYKAKVLSVTDDDMTILDRLGLVSVFPLSDIVEVSSWRTR